MSDAAPRRAPTGTVASHEELAAIADLAGGELVTSAHVAEAVQYRRFERA